VEHGKAEIGEVILLRISREFGKSLEWLLTGERKTFAERLPRDRQSLCKRAGVPYFRIYSLRSTYAPRLSAGGVANEGVTQLLRQRNSKVFKKYLQMKLQMEREALEGINRLANEMAFESWTKLIQ
jgi:hypothetical protein